MDQQIIKGGGFDLERLRYEKDSFFNPKIEEGILRLYTTPRPLGAVSFNRNFFLEDEDYYWDVIHPTGINIKSIHLSVFREDLVGFGYTPIDTGMMLINFQDKNGNNVYSGAFDAVDSALGVAPTSGNSFNIKDREFVPMNLKNVSRISLVAVGATFPATTTSTDRVNWILKCQFFR